MNRKRILVLDDETGVTDLLVQALGDDGCDVVVAATIAEFEVANRGARFDLYMIDIGLPDGNGLQVVSQVRRDGDCGVIILSGRGSETDRVVGLEVGADDYITKPFRLREMVARVHAVLRRTSSTQAQASLPEPPASSPEQDGDLNTRVEFDGFILDFDARELFAPGGGDIPLTTSEFNLLAALLRHRGQVLNRDQLMNAVKGRDWESYDRAVDGLISRLRKKIPNPEGRKSYIRTVHGVGYAFAGKTQWLNRD